MLSELLPMEYVKDPKKYLINYLNPTNILVVMIAITSGLARMRGLEDDLYQFLGGLSGVPILLAVASAWVVWRIVLQGPGFTRSDPYHFVKSYALLYVLAAFQVLMISTTLLSNFFDIDSNLRLLITVYLASFAYTHLQKVCEYSIKNGDKLFLLGLCVARKLAASRKG